MKVSERLIPRKTPDRLVNCAHAAPPNNSLKLTRRAGPPVLLVLPSGVDHNQGWIARVRRAA
jgi:hypothetical protein